MFTGIENTVQNRLYSMRPTTVKKKKKNKIYKNGKIRKDICRMLTVVISGTGVMEDFHFC